MPAPLGPSRPTRSPASRPKPTSEDHSAWHVRDRDSSPSRRSAARNRHPRGSGGSASAAASPARRSSMRIERSARTASVPASLARRLTRDCACLALLALALKRSMKLCRCARSACSFSWRDLLQAQVLGALALEAGVVAGVELGLAVVQVQRVRGRRRRGTRGRARSAAGCPGYFSSHCSSHSTASRSRWLVGSSSSSRSRRLHQRARQVQAHAPAAGKRRHRPQVGVGRKAQAVQQAAGARGRVVAVDFVQPVVRIRRRRPSPRRPSPRLRPGSRRTPRHRRQARNRSPDRAATGVSCADAGDAQPCVGMSRSPTSDSTSPRMAANRLDLAAAVAADHAHAPTGVQGQVDIGQQQAFAAAKGEIVEGNHRGGILPAPDWV